MRKCLTLLFVLALTSCSDSADKAFKDNILRPLNLWEPVPFGMQLEPPKGGTPEFNQGWTDGCKSGVAAYGGDHYKYLGYKFQQDWRMIKNQDYYQTWQDAYLYCRWYMWNYIQKPPGVAGQWIF